MLKKYIIQSVDWYVRNYYSAAYIHRDMIRDEIERRILAAETRMKDLRDRQERERLDALKLDFEIIENGYKAEIARLVAENRHEGTKIINDVADFVVLYKIQGGYHLPRNFDENVY